MQKVLMIAFHFPPAAMGSGHLRTLGFARHLPALGWTPIVLSASERAYPHTDLSNNKLVPDGCKIYRAPAFDLRRHFGIRGKYPAFLARPDRWASWWPLAVCWGLRLIRRHEISVIWSTYPIMTAHHIAYTLSHLSGLPWVADFRDPVQSSVEAGNRFSVSSQCAWDRRVIGQASRVVFTTPGALQGYARQYPEAFHAGRMRVVPNGYEEAEFADLQLVASRRAGRPLKLLHSGVLYRDGRNPVPFFKALANLRAAGRVTDDDLRIVLRASGAEAEYDVEIRRLGLEGMVTLASQVSNREALREQAEADALLLFQGERFDHQIPAKVYEYLRIGHPILALVGLHGDTATLLRDTGGAWLLPMEDVASLENGISEFILALREGRAVTADAHRVQAYSRYQGASSLVGILEDVASAHCKGTVPNGHGRLGNPTD